MVSPEKPPNQFVVFLPQSEQKTAKIGQVFPSKDSKQLEINIENYNRGYPTIEEETFEVRSWDSDHMPAELKESSQFFAKKDIEFVPLTTGLSSKTEDKSRRNNEPSNPDKIIPKTSLPQTINPSEIPTTKPKPKTVEDIRKAKVFEKEAKYQEKQTRKRLEESQSEARKHAHEKYLLLRKKSYDDLVGQLSKELDKLRGFMSEDSSKSLSEELGRKTRTVEQKKAVKDLEGLKESKFRELNHLSSSGVSGEYFGADELAVESPLHKDLGLGEKPRVVERSMSREKLGMRQVSSERVTQSKSPRLAKSARGDDMVNPRRYSEQGTPNSNFLDVVERSSLPNIPLSMVKEKDVLVASLREIDSCSGSQKSISSKTNSKRDRNRKPAIPKFGPTTPKKNADNPKTLKSSQSLSSLHTTPKKEHSPEDISELQKEILNFQRHSVKLIPSEKLHLTPTKSQPTPQNSSKIPKHEWIYLANGLHLKKYSIANQNIDHDFAKPHFPGVITSICYGRLKEPEHELLRELEGPDREFLWTACTKGYLKQWVLPAGNLKKDWGQIHETPITKIACTDDALFVFTFDLAKSMKMISVKDGKTVKRFKNLDQPVTALTLNPANTLLYLGDHMGYLKQFSLMDRTTPKLMGKQ